MNTHQERIYVHGVTLVKIVSTSVTKAIGNINHSFIARREELTHTYIVPPSTTQ